MWLLLTFLFNLVRRGFTQVIILDRDQCNPGELVKCKIKVHQHSQSVTLQVIWCMLDHPRIFFHQSVSEHKSEQFMCVFVSRERSPRTWPCLLERCKCNVRCCWSPGWQCIQQWTSEGLVLSPAYEGALPALKQPFICAQGLEMTMQPLLIAPDGAINKAMIHTGLCWLRSLHYNHSNRRVLLI